MKGQDVLFSSADDTWTTPDDLFAQLHAEFNFQVDVAASKKNAKLDRFYTEEDNALLQPWNKFNGRSVKSVFCNPPYSGIGDWILKANEESLNDCYFTIFMLVPNRRDTRWFHAIPRHVEKRDFKGRLKFGKAASGAPFPSLGLVWKGWHGPYRWNASY